jgi:hypothetical protein
MKRASVMPCFPVWWAFGDLPRVDLRSDQCFIALASLVSSGDHLSLLQLQLYVCRYLARSNHVVMVLMNRELAMASFCLLGSRYKRRLNTWAPELISPRTILFPPQISFYVLVNDNWATACLSKPTRFARKWRQLHECGFDRPPISCVAFSRNFGSGNVKRIERPWLATSRHGPYRSHRL